MQESAGKKSRETRGTKFFIYKTEVMLLKLFIFLQLSNIELDKHAKKGQITLSFGIWAQLQFCINLSTNPKNTLFIWHFNRISCSIGMNFR